MKPFKDREPSKEAGLAMAEARDFEDKGLIEEIVSTCKKALCKTTGHHEALVTDSGDKALYAALSAAERSVLLPDQGIWRKTISHCESLGLSTSILKTDKGLVDVETLNAALELHRPGAFLITSFAGYIAEQDVAAISKVCREHEVLLIEDASSSIGDKRLAKGRFSDIITGSARAPKPLNLPSGGFITSDNGSIMERIRNSDHKFSDPVMCAGMTEELKKAQATIDGLCGVSADLKKRLESAIHREKRGICVGVLSHNPKNLLKNAPALGLITKSGKSLFSTCPRYDRFLEKGLVVELKKIDFQSLSSEDIEEIARFIDQGT